MQDIATIQAPVIPMLSSDEKAIVDILAEIVVDNIINIKNQINERNTHGSPTGEYLAGR